MHRMLGTAAAALLLTASGAPAQDQVAPQPPGRPACLHESPSSDPHRARRDQAIRLAYEINAAQARARGLGRPGRARNPYLPLDQLMNVPAPPAGFQVQHHTSGEAYFFSIKDTLDPCKYAVFSDESGDVYEGPAITSVPKPGLRFLSQK